MELEIMGHKATIGSVTARAAFPPWHPEDKIGVYLNFGQAVDSILGFYVDLPVKEYASDEFLQAVKREADKQLSKMLEQQWKEREERNQREEKQKALDIVAGNIKSAIGLE